MLKKISVILQTYNEVENVIPIYEEIKKIFDNRLNEYDYEILFTDNHSEDGTIDKIKQLLMQKIFEVGRVPMHYAMYQEIVLF